MWTLKRIVKYGTLGAATVGLGISLHANDYDVNSIGIVRLARAGCAVFDIGRTYKQKLFYKEWDKTTLEYQQKKSEIHKIAAGKLLELCCTNKGVYIKVGQHIGALEYLLPTEYVQTMKILHSKAPSNPVEDLYKVIRQDLKKNVSRDWLKSIK
jgi:aarF domain-containing kinase